MSLKKINVYEHEDNGNGRGDIVARVSYNSNLDHWDGHNWSDGGVGTHLGITRLRDGRYVLIHGTQWQGCKDRGYIATNDEALRAILVNQPDRLADWPELAKLAAGKLVPEITQ